jgi:hypothetical protein
LEEEEGGFSNSPEMHRRDLEKPPVGYLTQGKGEGIEIHFSGVNYGYY